MRSKKTFFAVLILAATILNTACGSRTNTNSTGGTTTSTPAKSSATVISSKPNANAAEYEYKVENDGITITKYLGKDSEIVIPSQIEG